MSCWICSSCHVGKLSPSPVVPYYRDTKLAGGARELRTGVKWGPPSVPLWSQHSRTTTCTCLAYKLTLHTAVGSHQPSSGVITSVHHSRFWLCHSLCTPPSETQGNALWSSTCFSASLTRIKTFWGQELGSHYSWYFQSQKQQVLFTSIIVE